MNLNFKHFIFLQILDVLTTFIGLTYLGLREANTFANGLFQEYGIIFALLSMKIIGLMVIYLILSVYPLKIKTISLNICCFVFIIVVFNNSYQIIRIMLV